MLDTRTKKSLVISNSIAILNRIAIWICTSPIQTGREFDVQRSSSKLITYYPG